MLSAILHEKKLVRFFYILKYFFKTILHSTLLFWVKQKQGKGKGNENEASTIYYAAELVGMYWVVCSAELSFRFGLHIKAMEFCSAPGAFLDQGNSSSGRCASTGSVI